MRIRSVKSEYWNDAMHEGLSLGATILGAALLNFADDEGRFVANAKAIKGQVLTYVELDVEGTLQELAGEGFLVLYDGLANGKRTRLGQVVTFARHQSIPGWAPSLLPPPPGYRFVPDPVGEQKINGRPKKGGGKWVKTDSTEHYGNVSELISNLSGNVSDGPKTDSTGAVGKVSETIGMDGSERVERSGVKGVREGAGAPHPSGILEDGLRDGAGRLVDREPGAVTPTLEEVTAAGEQEKIPAAYCAHFWGTWEADHGWVKNGRLRDWRHWLREWWGRDAKKWAEGRHGAQLKNAGGEPPEGGTTYEKKGPVWARVKALEERIGGHVANRESGSFVPTCSAAEREELRGLRTELEGLKNGAVKL